MNSDIDKSEMNRHLTPILLGFLALLLLLGIIFYQQHQLRSRFRIIELNDVIAQLAPASLAYSCQSKTKLQKPIHSCKALNHLLANVVKGDAKLHYSVHAAPNVNNVKLRPMMTCIIENSAGDQRQFRAFKSFAARMSPVICPMFQLASKARSKATVGRK